jgi:putative ABC transport system ATP-binding protein
LSLRVEGLSHTYRSLNAASEARTVLQIGDWALERGQQVLLRGVSGSGKTTLFNILAGLLRPTTGTVYYERQSLYALPEEARDRFRAQQVGYVFQNHHLIGSLSALENVVMPMAFARALPSRQWRNSAGALLTQVGLGDFQHDLPRRLSTGQRLRVAIARALANRPRVLLADEPTAALAYRVDVVEKLTA